jgi:hypothetical protein
MIESTDRIDVLGKHVHDRLPLTDGIDLQRDALVFPEFEVHAHLLVALGEAVQRRRRSGLPSARPAGAKSTDVAHRFTLSRAAASTNLLSAASWRISALAALDGSELSVVGPLAIAFGYGREAVGIQRTLELLGCWFELRGAGLSCLTTQGLKLSALVHDVSLQIVVRCARCAKHGSFVSAQFR